MQAVPQSLINPPSLEGSSVAPSSSHSEVQSVEPSSATNTPMQVDQSSSSLAEPADNAGEVKPSVYEQLPLKRILPTERERCLLENWFRPTNISWCLICSRAGEIICCEGCPASFHLECLQVDDAPDKFFCEDCVNGRVPRYGEIVWVRIPPLTASEAAGAVSKFPPKLRFLRHTFAPDDVRSELRGVRWWPGEVLHPRCLRPGNARITDYDQSDNFIRLGFFPVRLFGLFSATHFNGIKAHEAAAVTAGTARATERRAFPVCLWTTQARVFYFEEGDADQEHGSETAEATTDNENENEQSSNSSDEESLTEEDPVMMTIKPTSPPPPARVSSSLTSPSSSRPRAERRSAEGARKSRRKRLRGRWRETYLQATRQANEALAARKAAREAHLKSSEDRPDFYEFIKTNRPIGAVRIRRHADPTEVTRCDCTAADPCGPNSGCFNRSVFFECHSSVCVHGRACRNQFFTQRKYPKQAIFYTGKERGWGLRTLEPIHEGDFVNEYVGDLIDEAEANRRLTASHKNNIQNFYMMKMDSQRIIDAGPKGNLSRFMNHSCAPNLCTQKWVVNGDARVGLFALRDIDAGEELTFNYNFCSLGQEMLACFCGADSCTGYLGARAEHNAATPSVEGSTATSAASQTRRRLKKRARAATGGEEESESTEERGGARPKKAKKRRTSVSGSSLDSASASIAPLGRPSAALPAATLQPSKKCYRCNKIVHNPQELSALSMNPSEGLPRPRRDEGACKLGKKARSPALGIVCPRSDCRKAYHIACLDIKLPITGRWVCPWHHCDACGRPSNVFCQRCTTSFCPSHVEGSVAVLPPPVPNGFAQIVCFSHTDLIERYKSTNRVFNDFEDESAEEEAEAEAEAVEPEEEEAFPQAGGLTNGISSSHNGAAMEDEEEICS